MKILTRSILSALLAFSTVAAATTASRPAHAQQMGWEYCPDLGVLVSNTGAGLVVRALRGNAIARQLNLRPGDLIFAINGQHPESLAQVHDLVFSGADEEDHDLDILRNGRHLHAAIFHVHGQTFMHQTLH